MRGDEALLYDPFRTTRSGRRSCGPRRRARSRPSLSSRPSGLAGQDVRQARGATAPAAGSPWEAFRRTGRIVIVGASLAGLRAGVVLRRGGFTGSLTVIGDEPCLPYDRPPLSKQVLMGQASARETVLPGCGEIGARWRLGVAATGVDLGSSQVLLADGEKVGFDRLLIATGVRRGLAERGTGPSGRGARGP